MAAVGLYEYVQRSDSGLVRDVFSLSESDFFMPGFWVALAAKGRYEGLTMAGLQAAPRHMGYAQAIKLPCALGEVDCYPHERLNEGTNYSPLILLESHNANDNATATVNACIRAQLGPLGLGELARDLCEVVGELHDNVWSHGQGTGFSMFQKWRKGSSGGHKFEFAVADCGIGFLRELQSVGVVGVTSHEEAIEWCIREGNSSKNLPGQDDGWGQSLPADALSNPMGGAGRVRTSDNNHQGLGLAKLVKLVSDYGGELWIVTGNKTLVVGRNGQRSMLINRLGWQGVAVACRFDTTVLKMKDSQEPDDEVLTSIIDMLGRGAS